MSESLQSTFSLLSEDWIYCTEGNQTIVFRATSTFSRWVLKVPKREVSLGFEGFHTIINSWFPKRFLLESLPVALDQIELSKMLDVAHPLRPSKRLKRCPLVHLPLWGILEEAAMKLPTLVAQVQGFSMKGGAEISFEFKVKCGLKSLSPFLVGERLIKRTVSRYTIMQLVKLMKTKTEDALLCPWGQFTGISSYDPCDLCSRNPCRIRKAIAALLQNPQNNLRICVDGTHIFGWDKTDRSIFDNLLGNLFSELNPIDSVVECLTEETLLEDLESLQASDIFLDIEGCTLALERLKDLLPEATEKDLQEFISGASSISNIEKLRDVHQWFRSLEAGDTSFLASVDCVDDALLSTLRDAAFLFRSTEPISHEDISRWAKALNAESCRGLLQVWLLALGAKDASIILTLILDEDSSSWTHKLSLIDYGPKPISKIWGKVSDEAEFCRLASAYDVR